MNPNHKITASNEFCLFCVCYFIVQLLVAVGADVDSREPLRLSWRDGDHNHIMWKHFTWPPRLWFITREPLLHDSSFLLSVLHYELQ